MRETGLTLAGDYVSSYENGAFAITLINAAITDDLARTNSGVGNL